MKHKRLYKAKDGEWIQPVMKNYLLGCCDCGLIHWMDFRIVEGVRKGKTIRRVQFKAKRAPKYTSRQRKKERIVLRGEK